MATASRKILVPALVLAAAIGLAGCSAGVNGAAGGASGDLGMTMPAGESVVGPAVDGALDSAVTGSTDRSIITTGWATILVDDPEASSADVAKIVDQAGGRIDARSVQAPTDYAGGSASLTIRVPADSLDDVLASLEDLGRVQNVSTSASDVTVAVQDLDARISALRSSIDRLVDLQAQADTVDALIALETAISDRQGELESLEAQQRYYDDQISMSTLQVDLVSEAVVAEPEPGSFWDGVQAGWNALVGFLAGAVVAIGVVIPWLIPLVVIAAIVWIIVAVSRSSGRRKPPTPPTTPAGPTQPAS
jgi:uncharacterized small protein (DUF1192 family)